MNNKNIRQKQSRSLKLIANFVNGYAEGWHFAVGEFFKDELDIKYTERVEKKKRVMRWTQGPYFCFKEGHIVYDTPDGYLQWSEALKHVNLICEVLRSTPNHLDQKGHFINGMVTFKLSRPNKEKTNIETIGQYDLTQNEFVDFLKNGNMKEFQI